MEGDWEKYLPVAISLAKEGWRAHLRRGVKTDLDEAVQVARIAAWEASRDYEPAKGTAFYAFLRRRILWALAKFFRSERKYARVKRDVQSVSWREGLTEAGILLGIKNKRRRVGRRNRGEQDE